MSENLNNKIDQQSANKLAELMMAGDPNCSYAIGDKIEKIMSEPGDRNEEGSTGTVHGNIVHNGVELYLVAFDKDLYERSNGEPIPLTFVVGYKIGRII